MGAASADARHRHISHTARHSTRSRRRACRPITGLQPRGTKPPEFRSSRPAGGPVPPVALRERPWRDRHRRGPDRAEAVCTNPPRRRSQNIVRQGDSESPQPESDAPSDTLPRHSGANAPETSLPTMSEPSTRRDQPAHESNGPNSLIRVRSHPETEADSAPSKGTAESHHPCQRSIPAAHGPPRSPAGPPGLPVRVVSMTAARCCESRSRVRALPRPYPCNTLRT